jgi:antitoxin CptB
MPAAPDYSQRLAAARFRAWHRGTREADLMIGGYFDRFHGAWDDPELAWFEAVLDADEADVMAWAMGAPAPPAFEGPQLDALRRLDYVTP